MRRWWLILSLASVAATKDPNWPQLYNEGVTAYRSNEFATAVQAFEQALPAQDRTLQQRALYNLGNTCYRLGEAQPAQAQLLWERAIKSYESALALDPNDADAKFNREYVKQKLEELKKQQEQQQQQKQQDQKDQDKQKQDQQKQQQDQQQQKQEPQEQQQQKQQEQDQQKQGQQQQQAKQDEKKKQQKQQAQAQQALTNNLDRVQASALLDNLREDERNWNFFPEVQMKDLKDTQEPAKDW